MGKLSNFELYQNSLTIWAKLSESLKKKIISYYKHFEPINSLYIMAFSGARGNISQVYQLLGMRGLMVDNTGQLMNLPIKNNFLDGLNILDYIISSYGARKGIVDTALKTAKSGFLTRKLIYLTHELIVREIQCKSKDGILIKFPNNINNKNLIGQFCVFIKLLNYPYTTIFNKNQIITLKLLNFLRNHKNLIIKIKTPLTCTAINSICQTCYGWDFSKEELILLGDAIGIIAAQSLGEPSTQLTMRTFHTGGIFTNKLNPEHITPFSGKLYFLSKFKNNLYRTLYGKNVLKIKQNLNIILINWKNLKYYISLKENTLLYLKKSLFLKKKVLLTKKIADNSHTLTLYLQPLYLNTCGYINFNNLTFYKLKNIYFTLINTLIWIDLGVVFLFPKESKIINYNLNYKKKSSTLGLLKIITTQNGLSFYLNKLTLLIINNKKLFKINFKLFNTKYQLFYFKLISLVKNYQYIDAYSVCAYVYIRTINRIGSIHVAKKQILNLYNKFFLISHNFIYKLYLNKFNNTKNNKKHINLLNINFFGILVNSNSSLKIFKKSFSVFLNKCTLFNQQNIYFIEKNKAFANVLNLLKYTSDITQSLPKLEHLLEISKPNSDTNLILYQGFLISNNLINKTNVTLNLLKFNNFKNSFKNSNQNLLLLSTLTFKNYTHLIYNNYIFNYSFIFPILKPILTPFCENYIFKQKSLKNYIILQKFNTYNWEKYKLINFPTNFSIYKNKKYSKNIKYLNYYNFYKLTEKPFLLSYKNNNNNFLLLLQNKSYLWLIENNSLKYIFNNNIKQSQKYNLGNFFNIGESLNYQKVNIYNLLNIFFNYHFILDGQLKGFQKSILKIKLILLNSIQAIYYSQQVMILNKHCELIVLQMLKTSKIKESNDTPFYKDEILQNNIITTIYKTLQESSSSNLISELPYYTPNLLPITQAILNRNGVLASISFQNTKYNLIKAALNNTTDWLSYLQESILINKYIPNGSQYTNSKHYLNFFIHLKKK